MEKNNLLLQVSVKQSQLISTMLLQLFFHILLLCHKISIGGAFAKVPFLQTLDK